MRLIDADKLKDLITSSTLRCTALWKRVTTDIIDNQPTIDMQNWIPCSERLPDNTNNELYDAHFITLKTEEVAIGVYRNKDEEWWIRRIEGETVYSLSDEVIAWMPLIKPYEGVE